MSRFLNKTTLLIGGSGLLVLSLVWPAQEQLWLLSERIAADGRQVSRAELRATNLWGQAITGMLYPKGPVGWDREAAVNLGLQLREDAEQRLWVRAGFETGQIRLWAKHHEATLRIQPSVADADQDGLPDALERMTSDAKTAFVARFTAIAERQYQHIEDAWPRVHQDCAGLVRYAFKEALKAETDRWKATHLGLPGGALPESRPPFYPELPFVGELPFRKRAGAFDPKASIESQFTAAPSAEILWQYNVRWMGSTLHKAKAGDLLFFRLPSPEGSRMHTMILLGDQAGASHKAPATRVVYHTGLAPSEGGEVRLMQLRALLKHPDLGWRPTPDNPRFLGVYRLNLLDFEPKRPLSFAFGDAS